jgi:hypothetical protein
MMIMKNAVFWDVAPCSVKQRFGGMYRLHLQGRKIREGGTSRLSAVCSHLLTLFLARVFFYPEDGDDTFLLNVGSHKIYYIIYLPAIGF